MFRKHLIAACTLAVVSGDAFAGPIAFNALDTDDMAWFYNKPEITLEQLRADTQACGTFANVVMNQGGGTPSGGLTGSVLFALNAGAPTRALLDHCMIARGYRRFNTADRNMRTFVTRYEAMSDAERLALASNETPPEGTLARAWANDYWIPEPASETTPRYVEMRPGFQEFAPFSLQAVDLNAPIAVGADQALVILSLQAVGPTRGGVIQFTRDNPETGAADRVRMGQSGNRRWPMISATLRERDASAEPTYFAFLAPAGFYAHSSAQARGTVSSQLCMGTIAFTAAPNAVLFLGNFVIERGSERTRMPYSDGFGVRVEMTDLTNVRQQLAASPDLAARLENADYRNGFVRQCVYGTPIGISPVHGFDIPGVPWIEQTSSAPTN
jgi:hypothetical protein